MFIPPQGQRKAKGGGQVGQVGQVGQAGSVRGQKPRQLKALFDPFHPGKNTVETPLTSPLIQ